jgi:hypothetical protein
MAWMSSHLFVRSADHAAVTEAVAGVLARPEHRASHEGLLDPPGPIVISPALDGWIAICGARAWIDDLVWAARLLSTSCDTLTISCEILGNSYRLRLSEQERGAERALRRTPVTGWLDQEEQAPGAMPIYEDVELDAYRALRALEVPTPLTTLGTSPLGYGAERMVELGEGTRLSPGSEGIAREQAPLRAAAFSGDDPPVVPSEVSQDFGLMLFESRYVEGLASDASVDRLVQIEEELLARAQRARPGSNVSLTVTYYGGLEQDRLDDLLRARGRPTAAYAERGDRARWWEFWRHFGKLR